MALKDLVIKGKGKPIPPASIVMRDALKRYGVSAPASIAAALMWSLHSEGYRIVGGPRPRRLNKS